MDYQKPSMDDLIKKNIKDLFFREYGREPFWLVSAPGRVNLIGEHVDYNGGTVIPMAIDKRTWIACALNGTGTVRLKSSQYDKEIAVDLEQELKPAGEWWDYIVGVFAGCRDGGISTPGLDVLIHSTVPPGSGLSSSAALEVGTATLVEAVTGKKMDELFKAKLCLKAEHDFAGVPCGLMDQLISTAARAGHVMVLNCATETYSHVPFHHPSVKVSSSILMFLMLLRMVPMNDVGKHVGRLPNV